MQQRDARAAGRAGDELGEEDDVLVREQVQIGLELRLVGELDGPEPVPRHGVGRVGERRLGAERTVRDVGHHVQAERVEEGDARVFDAGILPTVFPALIGREHHAEPLDADGDAVLDDDLGACDARDVARRDDARVQVQLAIRPPGRARVEDALRLQRIGRVGGHDRSEPV